MGSIEIKSPAPRANAGYRAHFVRNETHHTIADPLAEADFAAVNILHRFGLALPLTRTIAAQASLLGRVFL